MIAALLVIGPLLLGAVIVLIAAGITTGSRRRRGFGIALAVTTMLPVWLVPAEHSTVRGLWGIIAFAGLLRTTDLGRGQWSLRERLQHVLSIVDTRRIAPSRSALDHVAVLQSLAWGIVALGSYSGMGLAFRFEGAAFWVTRWFFALLFVYSLSDAAYGLLAAAYRLAGFITPPLHIAPVAAHSVQDFWGVRWNRTVSLWLAETFFRPLARRRHPALGAFAAFGVSAVVHAYITWVAISSWRMGLVMLGYFMSQALLMGLERSIGIRRWSPWAAHAWAIGWMVLLSPGFTEPLARTLGY